MTILENSLYADLNTGGVFGGVLASVPVLWLMALEPGAESHGSALIVSTHVGAMLGHAVHHALTASTTARSTP